MRSRKAAELCEALWFQISTRLVFEARQCLSDCLCKTAISSAVKGERRELPIECYSRVVVQMERAGIENLFALRAA